VGEIAAGQALAIAFPLVLVNLSQHGAQALAGDDVSLLDARLRVDEDAAGEKLPFVTDVDAKVLVLMDAAPVARKRKRLGPWFEEIHNPLVVGGQILRELAPFLPGEDPAEVLIVTNGPVGVVGASRLASEPLFVVGSGLGEVRVAGLGRRDSPQP
jgi:hypothetical protein